jgi:hypothetical protein
MRRLLMLAALALCTTTAKAQGSPDSTRKDSTKKVAAVLEGKWAGSIDTPNGSQYLTATFRKDSTGYTGTISSQQGDAAMQAIVLTGDKVTARTTVATPNGAFEIFYSWTLTNDTLFGAGETSFNGQTYSFPLTLKRTN